MQTDKHNGTHKELYTYTIGEACAIVGLLILGLAAIILAAGFNG